MIGKRIETIEHLMDLKRRKKSVIHQGLTGAKPMPAAVMVNMNFEIVANFIKRGLHEYIPKQKYKESTFGKQANIEFNTGRDVKAMVFGYVGGSGFVPLCIKLKHQVYRERLPEYYAKIVEEPFHNFCHFMCVPFDISEGFIINEDVEFLKGNKK